MTQWPFVCSCFTRRKNRRGPKQRSNSIPLSNLCISVDKSGPVQPMATPDVGPRAVDDEKTVSLPPAPPSLRQDTRWDAKPVPERDDALSESSTVFHRDDGSPLARDGAEPDEAEVERRRRGDAQPQVVPLELIGPKVVMARAAAEAHVREMDWGAKTATRRLC